jgi:hypothetical protein
MLLWAFFRQIINRAKIMTLIFTSKQKDYKQHPSSSAAEISVHDNTCLDGMPLF